MKAIYVMDPYCGWCYASSQHLLRMYETYRAALPFEVVPAGMLTGEYRQLHRPHMAEAVMRSNSRISKETGISFGRAYEESLNQELLLDSEVPSRAIISCKHVAADRAFAFTHCVLHARFSLGRDLNDTATYLEICEALGIDKHLFFTEFQSAEAAADTQAHFRLAEAVAEHYPTLIVESDGDFIRLAEGFTDPALLEDRIQRVILGKPMAIEDDIENITL